MNNFVHEGHFLEVTAPYDVTDGDGLMRGALFGIATSWARQGETVGITTAGVFDLKRGPDEHWDVGEPIYWDDAGKRFTRETKGTVMVGVAVSRTRDQDHPWVRGKLIGYAAS